MTKIEELSPKAVRAMMKGATAYCPGCLLDHEVPINLNGCAIHSMPNGEKYECHADTESWVGVKEFEEQTNAE